MLMGYWLFFFKTTNNNKFQTKWLSDSSFETYDLRWANLVNLATQKYYQHSICCVENEGKPQRTERGQIIESLFSMAPLCLHFSQWLLSADSSKAVDVMSVVHFWVSEQHAILLHWIGDREERPSFSDPHPKTHTNQLHTHPPTRTHTLHCQPNIHVLTHTVYKPAAVHRALWR